MPEFVSDFFLFLHDAQRHELTFSFACATDAEVQEKREQKRVAMAEYYEKHGGGDHH